MAYSRVSLETSGYYNLNKHITLTKAEIQEASIKYLD
jgi:hypothetical protein